MNALSLRLFPLLVLGIAVSGCAGGGAAATRPEATVTSADVNVTGTWHGQWHGQGSAFGSFPATLTLTQQGAKVTGTAIYSGNYPPRSGEVSGTVSGSKLQLTQFDSTADLTIQGDKMTGTLSGSIPGGRGQLDLTRHK